MALDAEMREISGQKDSGTPFFTEFFAGLTTAQKVGKVAAYLFAAVALGAIAGAVVTVGLGIPAVVLTFGAVQMLLPHVLLAVSVVACAASMLVTACCTTKTAAAQRNGAPVGARAEGVKYILVDQAEPSLEVNVATAHKILRTAHAADQANQGKECSDEEVIDNDLSTAFDVLRAARDAGPGTDLAEARLDLIDAHNSLVQALLDYAQTKPKNEHSVASARRGPALVALGLAHQTLNNALVAIINQANALVSRVDAPADAAVARASLEVSAATVYNGGERRETHPQPPPPRPAIPVLTPQEKEIIEQQEKLVSRLRRDQEEQVPQEPLVENKFSTSAESPTHEGKAFKAVKQCAGSIGHAAEDGTSRARDAFVAGTHQVLDAAKAVGASVGHALGSLVHQKAEVPLHAEVLEDVKQENLKTLREYGYIKGVLTSEQLHELAHTDYDDETELVNAAADLVKAQDDSFRAKVKRAFKSKQD